MAWFNAPERRFKSFHLALVATIFAVFVLGLGAFTRLVDAGLGCPDWPTCYGHILWPDSEQEVIKANKAFPDMPVIEGKAWPEMVHRYFAESLGLLVIAIFIIAVRAQKKRQPVALVSSLLGINVALTVVTVFVGEAAEPYAAGSVAVTILALLYLALFKRPMISAQPFKLPAFLIVVIIMQGLFGMWTVTWKLWPQVVTAHLLGGFTTFSLLWLLTLRLNNSVWQLPSVSYQQVKAFRPWVILGLVIVFTQVALGGWTTSNYAAVACPDLPTCQGQWLPEMNFSQGFNISQAIGPNYLGGTMDNESRIAIHYMHRAGALITTLYLLMIVYVFSKKITVAETRTMAKVIFSVLVLQVVLGLGNVFFHFPVTVAVAHNLVGALLLVTMVTASHRVLTAKSR